MQQAAGSPRRWPQVAALLRFVHYTWSAAIDTASEIFNPSSGEVAVAQDSFDLRSARARSTYDRPRRFTGNAVYELPFFREQKGAL